MPDQDEQVDVVVIGMGVGGEEVAGKLAEAGLAVIGVERELVGGECPYWGCIPSKMMIRGANLLTEARRIDGVAGTADGRSRFAPVAKRIRDEATDDWNDQVAADRFEEGRPPRPRERAASTVQGGSSSATPRSRRGAASFSRPGQHPSYRPSRAWTGTPYWTNREAISTTQVPDSLVVLGGGRVGLELAQAFARFGSRVTVVEGLDRILVPRSRSPARSSPRLLERDGMTVQTDAKAVQVARDGDETVVTLAGGTTVRGAELLVSVGRQARVAELGLETIGLDPKAKAVDGGRVDARGGRASGQSAMSPASACSPTWRCTRRASRSTTSCSVRGSPPTTAGWRG